MWVSGSTLQMWMIALFTLAVFSVLYKDNPFYRLVEHLYIGTAIGYSVMLAWFQYGKPTFDSILFKGKPLYIIPTIIGLLIYCRYFKPIAWLARYSLTFTLGYSAGYVISKDFRPLFITQLTATVKPLWDSAGIGGTLNNLVLVVGVVGTLTYFLFTQKRTGIIGAGATVGKWTMMLAFGSAFGNTVMARMSLLLGRVQFLLGDWLHVIK